jgi:hypothetical protein
MWIIIGIQWMDGVLVGAGSLWLFSSPHSFDSDDSSPTPIPPAPPPPLKDQRPTLIYFFSVLEVHEVTQLLFLRTLGAILEWVLCLLK